MSESATDTSRPASMVEREDDLTEARALRLQLTQSKDAAVKRAHEAGSTVAEMVRELGYSSRFIRNSLARQGLIRNAPVRLTKRKHSWKQVARHG